MPGVKNLTSVAFIPARGGSRRLPGKNIRMLNGSPLIAYSIAFAAYNGIDRIIVSTDDDQIARVSEQFGATVLFRPPAISGDHSPTAEAAVHCLVSEQESGHSPDVFVTLQPTNPLRPENLYRECCSLFSADCDSVISTGILREKTGIIREGYFEPLHYQPGERSQDIKHLYFESGLIYLTQPSVVINNKSVFGERIRACTVAEDTYNADIDTLADFEYVSFIIARNPDLTRYLNL